MRLKFIKLFEDYSKDPSVTSSETSHTWSDVRDAIQMKRPFVIVTFKNNSSYLDAIEDYFSDRDYIKQFSIFHVDGKRLKYPSIFFVQSKDVDFSNEVKDLYEKYDILQIVIGDTGSEYAKLYTEDGSSSEFGNEIISTLEPKDFGTEDCFKLGSTYYRFIGFDN